MIRNRKVQRLLIDNQIEHNNYSLVLRLKQIIQDLKKQISDQDCIIQQFKKDTKTTKIREMEVEIQHLTDENKRLMLLFEEIKRKPRSSPMASSKKGFGLASNQEWKRPVMTEIRVESRMSDVLKENESLKRELLGFKVNESFSKKRKPGINDRSSIFLQKNLVDLEKMQQKKLDLQAERLVMLSKIEKLQRQVAELSTRNLQLQKKNWLDLQLSNHN